MKRKIMTLAAAGLFAASLGGSTLAANDDVAGNPTNNDSTGYCVTNHQVHATTPAPWAKPTELGRGANNTTGALTNADIYGPGGIAAEFCDVQPLP